MKLIEMRKVTAEVIEQLPPEWLPESPSFWNVVVKLDGEFVQSFGPYLTREEAEESALKQS
jgi:hypothetical protein